MTSEQKLKDVKRRYSLQLFNQKGVSGVGIEKDETGDYTLTIHLDNTLPETLDLPEEIKKYPIKFVRQDGGFQKFSAETKN